MLDLIFDIGNKDRPRGHALVYYKDPLDSEKHYATYIVVFPLRVNISKYVPPFLATSLGATSITEISSIPMPPVPEEVESYDRIARLARSRDDDLIYGGTQSPNDVAGAMSSVNEIAQRYTELWNQFDTSQPAAITEAAEEGVAVNEVMYSLLGERDKLTELSKLVVRLKFASSGQDALLQSETEAEIQTLARYLPEQYQMDRFLGLALDSSDKSTKLTQLYLERCYGLSERDSSRVQQLDQEIKGLEDAL